MAQPKNQQDIARIDALFQVVPTESVSTRIWIGAKYVQADEDVRGQYQVSSLEEIEEMRKQQYGDRCSYQFVGMDGEGQCAHDPRLTRSFYFQKVWPCLSRSRIFPPWHVPVPLIHEGV